MNVEVPLGGLLFGMFMLGFLCGFMMYGLLAAIVADNKVSNDREDIGDGK